VDRTGEAYRAVALRKTSFLRLLRPGLLLGVLRARREGHRQVGVHGDPWQLGGTILIAPGDRVLLAQRDEGPEDAAPLDDALRTLRGRAA
jgi:hypothetical protein